MTVGCLNGVFLKFLFSIERLKQSDKYVETYLSLESVKNQTLKLGFSTLNDKSMAINIFS